MGCYVSLLEKNAFRICWRPSTRLALHAAFKISSWRNTALCTRRISRCWITIVKRRLGSTMQSMQSKHFCITRSVIDIQGDGSLSPFCWNSCAFATPFLVWIFGDEQPDIELQWFEKNIAKQCWKSKESVVDLMKHFDSNPLIVLSSFVLALNFQWLL